VVSGRRASVVELEVHIPEGIANVAEDWKVVDGDLRILRSRWEWAPDGTMVRKTWRPSEKAWSDDAKAGGADNVFKSRLPRPLRIGSLEDADKTEEVLLTLALSPFVTEMQLQLALKASGTAIKVRLGAITCIAAFVLLNAPAAGLTLA